MQPTFTDSTALTTPGLTGELFTNIVLGNGEAPGVREYFDQEYSSETGNGRAQRESDERDNKPWPINIIPRLYQNQRFRDKFNVHDADIPTYTVKGEVVVGADNLSRGLYITRCLFLDTVDFAGFTCDHDITISGCSFSKDFLLRNLTLKKLEISNIIIAPGELIFYGCTIEELIIKGDDELLPLFKNSTINSFKITE